MLAGVADTDVILDREAHTTILTRVLVAGRDQVFEAWTRPEHVACWWDPTAKTPDNLAGHVGAPGPWTSNAQSASPSSGE